jgi:CHAP domain
MAQTAQSIGARIAGIARGELGMKACGRTTNGKPGYFTSCHSDGKNGPPELWCSDFARWVWWTAGALNTDLLTPAAGSFGRYGPVRPGNPRVGDAVLFDYNAADHTAAHVAIVIEVNADGTIVTIGGDENGDPGGTDQHWASTSCVAQDGPYNGASKSTDPRAPGHPLSGYVSPVEDDMPYTKQQIVELVQQGVAAELHAKLDSSGITTAQGAEAAVQARDALSALSQQVAELKMLVSQALTAAAKGSGATSAGGAAGGVGATGGSGTSSGSAAGGQAAPSTPTPPAT